MMRLAIYYINLQLKKSIRVIPVFFVSIVLMILLSVIGILFAGKLAKDASSFEKVNVAIVIPDESKTSKQVMSFVHSMENVNAVCNFIYIDKEKAEQGLKKGFADVAILISPNFYDDVNSGINSPVTVQMAQGNELESSVFKELLADGVKLIQITEASIYGTGRTMKKFDMKKAVPDMEDLFTEIYVKKILQREETFEQTILSPAGMHSLPEYYATAIVLIIAAMTGMCFGFLYRQEEIQIMKLLRGRGLTPILVSFGKITTMALQVSVFVIICYVGMGIYSSVTKVDLIYPGLYGVIQIILVSISIAAYFHMVYSLFSQSGNGGIIIFMCNVLMCVFSGILIPFNGLPEKMIVAQKYIPFTIWQQCMQTAFGGDVSAIVVLKILVMTVVFITIGVFGLCKKA